VGHDPGDIDLSKCFPISIFFKLPRPGEQAFFLGVTVVVAIPPEGPCANTTVTMRETFL